MFMEGQSIGQIRLECLNATSYDALDKVCGPDGAIMETNAVYTCEDANPNCVQCGEPGVGVALCLDTTEVPSDCNGNATTSTSSPASSPTSGEESGCLVGDIMFMEGDSIGQIGLECLTSTSYNATESFCGPDGAIIESEAVYTCPETSSYCVQCGVAGEIGSALCLSSPEIPSDCSGSTTTAEVTTDAAAPTTSTAVSTPTTTTTSGSSVKNIASVGIVLTSSVLLYSLQSL